MHLSDNGQDFTEVGRITTGDGDADSFWWRSTTARYFRLTVHEASASEGAVVDELKLRILKRPRLAFGELRHPVTLKGITASFIRFEAPRKVVNYPLAMGLRYRLIVGRGAGCGLGAAAKARGAKTSAGIWLRRPRGRRSGPAK